VEDGERGRGGAGESGNRGSGRAGRRGRAGAGERGSGRAGESGNRGAGESQQAVVARHCGALRSNPKQSPLALLLLNSQVMVMTMTPFWAVSC